MIIATIISKSSSLLLSSDFGLGRLPAQPIAITKDTLLLGKRRSFHVVYDVRHAGVNADDERENGNHDDQ